jgi:hypothetical protein
VLILLHVLQRQRLYVHQGGAGRLELQPHGAWLVTRRNDKRVRQRFIFFVSVRGLVTCCAYFFAGVERIVERDGIKVNGAYSENQLVIRITLFAGVDFKSNPNGMWCVATTQDAAIGREWFSLRLLPSGLLGRLRWLVSMPIQNIVRVGG